MGIELLEIFS